MEVQALLITFREALEALLIVGIITSYLKRVQRSEFVKYVWLGAGLAVVASLLIALVFQVVFSGFSGMKSEIFLKVGIMFVSVVLLSQMVFWMAKQSKDIKGKEEGKLDQFITTGNVWGMVLHSFLVVVREGVETVFFFVAISGGDVGKAMSGWGAMSGILLAATVAFMFFRGTMRIPLSTFFKLTGGFIVLIAAGLLVQGISMLQDLGYIPSVWPHVYDLTWFLPEHPIDEQHFIRNTGLHPILSGQIGVFLKALFGYSSSPSIEEIGAYLGYYVVLYALLSGRKKRAVRATAKKEEQSGARDPQIV